MPPSDRRPAGPIRLEDLGVDPLVAERIRLRATADVVIYAELTGKSATETVETVMNAVGISELTARRMMAGLRLGDAVLKLQRIATYPGKRRPGLRTDRVARWEAGKERVPPRWLSAFCTVYHVSPRQLGYRDHTPAGDP